MAKCLPLGKTLASIDIGSHTARLLVVQKTRAPQLYRTLLWRRGYIRLVEDLDPLHQGAIGPDGIERTLEVLSDFAALIRELGAEGIHAVCTGVVRRAGNRGEFLRLIRDRTAIEARVISGEEEARLTEKGVLHALRLKDRAPIIFDLGGGSTEFVFGPVHAQEVKSVPLGAALLSQRHLRSDPPAREEMEAVGREVDHALRGAFSARGGKGLGDPLVGTGGTVTALAAMIHGIGVDEISPARMNGLLLQRDGLERVLQRIQTMTRAQRRKLPGLEPGRADIIPAGCMAVLRILRFFGALQMMVSLSDLLEGIIIECLEGETYG